MWIPLKPGSKMNMSIYFTDIQQCHGLCWTFMSYESWLNIKEIALCYLHSATPHTMNIDQLDFVLQLIKSGFLTIMKENN